MWYFFQFNEEVGSPFLKKFKTIIHPGEVYSNFPFCYVFPIYWSTPSCVLQFPLLCGIQNRSVGMVFTHWLWELISSLKFKQGLVVGVSRNSIYVILLYMGYCWIIWTKMVRITWPFQLLMTYADLESTFHSTLVPSSYHQVSMSHADLESTFPCTLVPFSYH